MIAMTVSDVVRWTDGQRSGGQPGTRIRAVATDGRQIRPGDLFVALHGERCDGHEFVGQAVANGAAAIVVDRAVCVPEEIAVIRAADTLLALRRLGAAWRRELPGTVVAITGSVGKTTAKDVLAHALSGAVETACSPKSFNNAIGVPLTLLSMTGATRVAIVEMGANAPGEIDDLARIARPDLGVITTVRESHLEGFGTLDGVRRAKGELLAHLEGRTAFLNADDPSTSALAAACPGRVVLFGRNSPRADVRALRVLEDQNGLVYSISVHGRVVTGGIPLAGRYQVQAVLVALAVLSDLSFDLEAAAERLASYQPREGRMRRFESGGALVFDDSYNASPSSVREAVAFLSRVYGSASRPRRIVLVLGDMLELGDQALALHRRVGREIATRGAARLIAVGPMAAALAREARSRSAGSLEIDLAADAEEASRLVMDTRPGDCVLVKGSRRIGLDRVVTALAERAARPAQRSRELRLEAVTS